MPGFIRRELVFLPILIYFIVSFVVLVSAWHNAGWRAGLAAVGTSVISVVAGGGLKASLWWGHPVQKVGGLIVAVLLMALAWWLSHGFSVQLFGQYISGTLWGLIGFAIVFVFTTKELTA